MTNQSLYTTVLVMLFFLVFSNAQQNTSPAFDFGKVSPEDISMLHYDKDTVANALVLYEKGVSKIEKNSYGFVVLSTEVTRRIKILKPEGVHEATVEIPLHKSTDNKRKEKFIKAEAISFNDARPGTWLHKKDIFTEHVNENYDLVKFTIPDVKEGTVIDYRYKTESPFLFNFNTWRFQSDLPKLYSEYHTSIPANYKYNIKLTGFQPLHHKESVLKKDCFYFQGVGTADCVVSNYIMKDIPAFKEEDHMISRHNYLSAIDYELETFEGFDGMKKKYTKSWKDVDKEIKYGEEIGKQARKENYFSRLIPSEISEMTTGLEKAKKIYYSLQKELFWNNANYIFTRVDVKEAFDRKSGSHAELNLILLNFLKAEGFKADFMLLSTRDQSLPTKLYPVISEFNYLVVKLDIEDQSYLLDISDKNVLFGMLPFKALNSYGRVMDMENGSYWYDITPLKGNKTMISTQISLSDSRPATIAIQTTSSGYHALSKRNKLRSKSQEEYEESLQDEFDKQGLYELEKYTVDHLESPEDQLAEHYSLVMENDTDAPMIVLYPFIAERITKNPFTLEERTYPVDFGYPFSFIYITAIDLGEHYEIKELPGDKIMKLEDGSAKLTYHTSRNGNVIYINSNLKFSRPIFTATEYGALKKLYTELISLQNKQPVILEKKL